MRHVQLKAFHAVAVHGGFSRAADALYLTQPAISDQVRKLESEYDTRLFNRTKRNVTLTSEGEKLFKITSRLFEIENQAHDLLSSQKKLRTGTLRLHVDSAIHVLGVLAQFRKKFRRVKIQIETGNTNQVIDALQDYRADIGVLGSVPTSSNMDVVQLNESPIVAFTSADGPLHKRRAATLQELAKHPLVCREAGSKTRQKLIESAAATGIAFIPSIVAQGREAVAEIVAAGVGIGFVSEKEFTNDPRFKKINITSPRILMSESVASLSERRENLLIKTFMTLVKTYPF